MVILTGQNRKGTLVILPNKEEGIVWNNEIDPESTLVEVHLVDNHLKLTGVSSSQFAYELTEYGYVE